MDDAALEDRASRGGAAIKRRGKRVLHRQRPVESGQAVISHEMDKAVARSKDEAAIGVASQTRAALSTMASRTGCTSVGERLMMPSTSAVAV